MDSIKKLFRDCEKNPANVRFSDLLKICTHYFGENRSKGSHYIFKTPWPGDPRINIQNDNGKAKTYQVKQVLMAVNKLGGDYNGYKKKL